jgi:hypothetical protein
VVLDQNALVINTGDKLAVFETGMSSVKAQARHPWIGRSANQILIRRSQALSDSVAYLFHGMLRHYWQRDHEGA